ncbi:MAG: auracyanin family protein, partial [Bacteroidota bacterium]
MRYCLIILASILFIHPLRAQEMSKVEAEYFPILTQKTPKGVVLETSGLAFLPDGKLAVATRRGEVWLLDKWDTEQPDFTLFANGLHEPLGLAWYEGDLLTTQRSEVTRLGDRNKDGRADKYETVSSWPLTANYHEYSYGPELLPNGDMMITLNVGWEGGGVSKSPWRGWMMRITQEGELKPYAAGMRSPAGFGFNAEGDIFYAENQGDWVGSGRMTHMEEGDFAGHPASLNWANEEGSTV